MYTVEITRHHIDVAPTKYTNIISFKMKRDFIILHGKLFRVLVNLYEVTEIIIRDQHGIEVKK